MKGLKVNCTKKIILDWATVEGFVQENLRPHLNVLRDVVDYGTHLIVRCWSTCKKEKVTTELVALNVLLEHAIEMLDGIHVNLTHAAVASADNDLRALLEAFLQLEWMLKENTENRARTYYIGSVRKKLNWCLRVLPGTAEHAKFSEALETLSVFVELDRQEERQAIEKIAQHDQQKIESWLARPENAPMDAEFASLRGKRTYDVSWFELQHGPKSIRQIADRLGRMNWYLLIYSISSETMHADVMDDHVSVGTGTYVIEPIRHPRDFENVFTSAINIAAELFEVVLAYYRPGELENHHKCRRKWSDALRSFPKIKVTADFSSRDVGSLPPGFSFPQS